MNDFNLQEILRAAWGILIVFSVFLSVISFFWGFVDLIGLMRFEGKIKKGIKIWSKPLQDDIRRYLVSLSTDVVETKKTLLWERPWNFIRKQNQEVLIQTRRPHWGTSWPYVGYVDLSEPDPLLQFRSSLPMHLFLVPFVLSIVGIPFVLALMAFNYYMESSAIENFLKRKIAEGSK